MLKKILAAANRPRKPANKRAILRALRFQLLFLGIAFAFAFAILDMANIVPLRANALGVFLFIAFGGTVGMYLDIHEAGLEGDDVYPDRS